MKVTFLLTISLLLILICCQSNNSETKQKDPIEKLDFNQKWLQTLNGDGEHLNEVYDLDFVKVDSKGNAIKGITNLREFLAEPGYSLDSIWQIQSIKAGRAAEFEYTIGGFEGQDAVHRYLTIRNIQDNAEKIVFEFVDRSEPIFVDSIQLTERRNRWMELCNDHKVNDLVNELYLPNSIYYNHKPLVVGRSSIIQEYQYMNDPKYQLTLEPIVIEPVNAQITFEIGQCKGSYGGKYILIWQKDPMGQWSILLDSNI